MTFEEYVNSVFTVNLTLAREEAAMEDSSDDIETRAWRFATEWTQDDIANHVGRFLGQKWAARQEGINKVFYG